MIRSCRPSILGSAAAGTIVELPRSPRGRPTNSNMQMQGLQRAVVLFFNDWKRNAGTKGAANGYAAFFFFYARRVGGRGTLEQGQ